MLSANVSCGVAFFSLNSGFKVVMCPGHLGYFSDNVIPTGRGFDSFFGYYGGAEDYNKHNVGKYLDLHDDVAGGPIAPAEGYDGKYSTHIYTDRAIKVISKFGNELNQWKTEHHPQPDGPTGSTEDEPSLFMYLAYQAIHSPDQAPQSYIDRFKTVVPNDHRRIVAGMISALDDGVGNVTKALHTAGLAERTIIIFTTDNASTPRHPAPLLHCGALLPQIS
jgi:arylsulfatase A-like enzyme